MYRILRLRGKHPSVDFNMFTDHRAYGNSFNSSNNNDDEDTLIQSKRKKSENLSKDNYRMSLDQYVSSFLDWRQKWTQVPRIIIVSCKSDNPTGRKFAELTSEIYGVIQQYTPKDTIVIMLRSPICCPATTFKACCHVDTLLFSSVAQSSVSVMAWQTLNVKLEKKVLLRSLQKFLINQEDLKLLLFFYDISSKHNITRWIKSTFCSFLKDKLKAHRSAVVLGCALHDKHGIKYPSTCGNKFFTLMGNTLNSSDLPEKKFKNGSFLCLALNGKSVNTASVHLDYAVRTLDGLSAKLRLLKESTADIIKKLSVTSFGIMIGCVNRMHDSLWYEDSEEYETVEAPIEINAFQKEFPGMPLLVMHGFGEVGNSFNLLNNSQVLESARLFHSASTIFTIVSFT
ncbi:unnamed protein product [Clavelina lepadiformis]|uniref:Uncharacterized protein n=1 Tax=Clavelina lepadiformis TaxID=159417 RepID=A0ABP0GWR6_CLALP